MKIIYAIAIQFLLLQATANATEDCKRFLFEVDVEQRLIIETQVYNDEGNKTLAEASLQAAYHAKNVAHKFGTYSCTSDSRFMTLTADEFQLDELSLHLDPSADIGDIYESMHSTMNSFNGSPRYLKSNPAAFRRMKTIFTDIKRLKAIKDANKS